MKAVIARILLLGLCTVFCAASESDAATLRHELDLMREQIRAQRKVLEAQERQLTALSATEAAVKRRLQSGSWVTAEAAKVKFNALEDKDDSFAGAMDSIWILLCGSLVMFMHAGFAMLETGCCRAKNCQNVLMKNVVNVCVGTLGWWIFGWAFAYGGPFDNDGKLENQFIGSQQFLCIGFLTFSDGKVNPFQEGENTSLALSWFFQWAFCTCGATIVSGGVAERVKSPTYAAFAFFMTSFIYPCVVAWTWGYGWLGSVADVGYMDFAGSGVVHLVGGVSALAGTVILGPRKGRWENPDDFEAHNLPLVVLGTFALWFGWYGFNPGSTLALHSKESGATAANVAMTTTLSAATGGISVFLIRYALLRKYDVGGLCNGILAGLVSITAACATVESSAAFAIGLCGAFIYQGASMLLQKLKIDDPVDAVPVHCACGMWSLVATALFDWGEDYNYYHGWSLWDCIQNDDGTCMSGAGGKAIGVQLLFILIVILWSGTWSTLGFFVLSKIGKLRISEEVEQHGMDHMQHSPPKAYALPGASDTQLMKA
eukprot:gb/GFBE01006305.1/.p1 GENE.gb/GFBE01006305.1/~~gb/GFBE01006305.1/.p1  ORF type:complete len:544 (+),score=136.98 gb/GFBE01006305.1/:1-1632(+)